MSDKNEHADLLADTVRINCVHCTCLATGYTALTPNTMIAAARPLWWLTNFLWTALLYRMSY